jgi:hypothetical protein
MDRVSGYFYTKLQKKGTKFSPNSRKQKTLQQSANSYLKGNLTEKIPEEI